MSDVPNESIDSEINFDSSEELVDLTLSILEQTNRTLDISSRHLDPVIYDDDRVVTKIKQIILDNRLARVRIIIHDPAPVISRGHRLIELAQRLSSYISLRTPGLAHRNFNEAMLIADNLSYTHRQFADRYEGVGNINDRGKARDLTSRFEDVWEKAEHEPNLRRLHL